MATGVRRARLPPKTTASSSSSSSSSFSLAVVIIFATLSFCLHGSHAGAENATAALLTFKSSLINADAPLANWKASKKPPCSGNKGNWIGVICLDGQVFGLQLENMNLKGQIDVDALVPLRSLRSLSFMGNAFEGVMPDWKKIGVLKALYLSNNQFSGEIAQDAFKGMTSLKKVHLANNKFTGHIPATLESPKLIELKLENNQFTGTIPAISSDHLEVLDVSNNQLEGPIPDPLLKFDSASFSGNKALCGKPLGSECNKNKTSPATIAIIVASVVVGLIVIVLLFLLFQWKRDNQTPQLETAAVSPPPTGTVNAAATAKDTQVSERSVSAAAAPVKKQEQKPQAQAPGKLSFVREDRQKFDLQDLMRASAEVLGSGNFGASYKAVLVDGEALVVKRFKQMNSVGKEDFYEHMRRLGRLQHPNVLPLVAYLYRKEEKLFVIDFVHNGSLSSHLHGKHSAEQPGLSWETRLKIIKGVGKGLAYLQSELPSLTVAHGHLKSSNVLLDKDFNPVLMDYALAPIVNANQVHQILVGYKSPEYAKSGRTSKKTDVWCFGILILETLTGRYVGKHLAQGPGPYGADLAGWINAINAAEAASVFDKEMAVASDSSRSQMEKLLQVGLACCQEDPEKRLDIDEAIRQIEQVQDS